MIRLLLKLSDAGAVNECRRAGMRFSNLACALISYLGYWSILVVAILGSLVWWLVLLLPQWSVNHQDEMLNAKLTTCIFLLAFIIIVGSINLYCGFQSSKRQRCLKHAPSVADIWGLK